MGGGAGNGGEGTWGRIWDRENLFHTANTW